MISEPENNISFKVALVGASGVGKSTLASNFVRGFSEEDADIEGEGENGKLNSLRENNFQIDLDYNKSRYKIDIEELDFKDIQGDYVSSFDAVIYMFSVEDPESFISLREFFIRQIASGNYSLIKIITFCNVNKILFLILSDFI